MSTHSRRWSRASLPVAGFAAPAGAQVFVDNRTSSWRTSTATSTSPPCSVPAVDFALVPEAESGLGFTTSVNVDADACGVDADGDLFASTKGLQVVTQ